MKPYNTDQTKKEEVREMFDNIAPKYDLLNHPNVKFTPEKGGAPYVHGGTELSVGSLSLSTVPGKETRFINLSEMEFELLSDEEIEAELLSGGNNNEEHH